MPSRVTPSSVNPARRNDCLSLCAFDTVRQPYMPAAFSAVNRHGNLGVARRMVRGSSEDEKLWAKLRDGKDAAVHAEVNLHVRGVNGSLCFVCIHEQSSRTTCPCTTVLRGERFDRRQSTRG